MDEKKTVKSVVIESTFLKGLKKKQVWGSEKMYY